MHCFESDSEWRLLKGLCHNDAEPSGYTRGYCFHQPNKHLDKPLVERINREMVRLLFVTYHNYCKLRGRDSSVGISTRYGLDGPAMESRWGGGEISRTRPGA